MLISCLVRQKSQFQHANENFALYALSLTFKCVCGKFKEKLYIYTKLISLNYSSGSDGGGNGLYIYSVTDRIYGAKKKFIFYQRLPGDGRKKYNNRARKTYINYEKRVCIYIQFFAMVRKVG